MKGCKGKGKRAGGINPAVYDLFLLPPCPALTKYPVAVEVYHSIYITRILKIKLSLCRVPEQLIPADGETANQPYDPVSSCC